MQGARSRSATRIDQAPLRLVRVRIPFAGLVGLAAACSPSQPPPTPTPVRAVHTTQYLTVNGGDTVSREIVTVCFGRLIGDVNLFKSRIQVHYEVEFGSDRLPNAITFSRYMSSDTISRQPDQVARTFVRGDSVFTEVMQGGDRQLQSSIAPSKSFLWMSGYAGLLNQLLDALTANVASAPLPLFFIATRGHIGSASIKRSGAGSLVVTLDSTEIAARWTPAAGLQSAEVTGHSLRVDRVPFPFEATANARCGHTRA